MTDQKPQFEDGPPMPEMCEALLSPDDIENLFGDLAQCTQIIGIQTKGGEQDYAESAAASLEDAKRHLLEQRVRALQIRYAYQGDEWTDTLMSLPTGIRLVRCQHSS